MTPLPDFHTPVRGHAFAARPPDAPPVVPGDTLRLVREPDNPADPHAVAVWSAGAGPWRLGYLDRTVAARIAPRIDAGTAVGAVLAGWTAAAGGRWHRPLLRLAVGRPERAVALAAEAPATYRAHPTAPAPGDLPVNGLFGRPPGSSRRIVPARLSPARGRPPGR